MKTPALMNSLGFQPGHEIKEMPPAAPAATEKINCLQMPAAFISALSIFPAGSSSHLFLSAFFRTVLFFLREVE